MIMSGYVNFLIFLISIVKLSESQRVLNIGNELKASASGVDVAGTTFLMNDAVLTEGVVFAFSAFFRTDSAVRFQVWRPMSNSARTRTYMLVSEIRVIPAVQYMREDIYIESRLTEKCTRVYAGDRLGIFFEASPGAISYVFDPSQPKALAYTSEFHNLTYSKNDYIAFDTLTFPYDFSVSAYIDTELSRYTNPNQPFQECPRGLLIPDYQVITLPPTTPTPPPTGRPGDTGATGPVGPGGNAGYTGATGPWGRNGVNGGTGATGRIGSTGLTGATGSVGATGTRGSNGIQGATGPTGRKGDRGNVGPAGPPGPPGSIDSFTFEPPVSEVRNKSGLSNPMLSLALLIWLIIITIVLIIVIIVLIVRHRRKQEQKSDTWKDRNIKSKKQSNSFLFHTEKTPVQMSPSYGLSKEESWLASLKEETESSYSVDTIDEYGHKKKKNSKRNNRLGSERSLDISSSSYSSDKYGRVNHGADLDQNANPHPEAVNSIYQNLDVPKHELTNY